MMRWLLCVLLLWACVSCQQAPPKDCGDEEDDTVLLTDNIVEESAGSSVVDPTAAGQLSKESPSGHSPVKSVLLLDYSGSMYGGRNIKEPPSNCKICNAGVGDDGKPQRNKQPYFLATKPFQKLMAEWVSASIPEGTQMGVEILMYNGKTWRLNKKDKVVALGERPLKFERRADSKSQGKIRKWLQAIPDNPYDIDDEAPRTTEAAQALDQVLKGLGNQEAIVWMLTDNVIEHKTFYKKMRDDARLQMVSAYPIHARKACSWLCGSSLLMYGFYISPHLRPESEALHRIGGTQYGEEAAQKNGLLWNPALRKIAREHSGQALKNKSGKIVAGAPVRIKPIDAEVLSFSLQIEEGQAIRCQKSREYGEDLKCFARANLRNSLRHQIIEKASLSFSNTALLPRTLESDERLPWAPAVCGGEIELLKWQLEDGESGDGDDPIVIGPLGPQEAMQVEMLFRVPGGKPSYSSWGDFLEVSLTEKVYLVGTLQAHVEDIKTRMFIDPRHLKGVYGAADLPGIFKKRMRKSSLTVAYPVAAVVTNDGRAFGLLVAGAVAIPLLLFLMLGFLFKKAKYIITLDGQEQAISVGLGGYRHREGDGVLFILRHIPLIGPLVMAGPGIKRKKEQGSWKLEHSDSNKKVRQLKIRRK